MNAKRKAAPDYAAELRELARRITGNGSTGEQLARWVGAVTVFGILSGALLFFVLYFIIDLPDANADFESQRTNVYYSDGKHKIGTFAMQERENVPLNKVAEPMKAAVVAAEDRTFYTNRGIDLRGILRALRNNTRSGEITGGGSTITQQYVKVLYLTQSQSGLSAYVRKLREAILAIKIHNRMSKEDTLQGYLNLVYYGNGAYGVEVASQTYFDKPASKLNYREAAVLAAAINQPSIFDPYTDAGRQAITPRYNYVLDGMAQAGAITSEQAAEAENNLPTFSTKKEVNRYAGPKGYILKFVQQQMSKLGFTESQILGGGYDIVTTIGWNSQLAAEKAMDLYRQPALTELHTALVSIKPGDGGVRAMYGGPDYLQNQINWATFATQPGSTFKAFALVAALEDGYSLLTKLDGSSPYHFGESSWAAEIENQGDSGGESFGSVNLKYATQKSINTAYVDLVVQMSGGKNGNIRNGAEKVLLAANAAGIPKSTTDKIEPVAVTPLGFVPVAPIDMANAYATLAAGGRRAEWYVVDHINDPRSGSQIYKHKVKVEQTIPADVAGDAIVAMQNVVSAGTGTRARTFCPTAGKTGTATAGPNDDQHVSSSWFVGYTPEAATAVMFNRGAGNEALDGYLRPFYGGTYPAMTFKSFMDNSLDRSACGKFVPPGKIVSTKGKDQKDNSCKSKKKKKKQKCENDDDDDE